MEFLRQLLNGIAQAWQRLSLSARVNLVLASLVTVAAVVGIVLWGSKVEYVRLYEGLDAQETAQIVDILREEGVLYKIMDGGQTVLVPHTRLSDMRMAVSSKGLPTSQGRVPGFEIFNQQDLMTSQWLQDVNYMRAVQGELQRQLNSFNFVSRSLVFIREAKEALFTSEQQPSEASVTLDTNRTLTEQEVNAVLHTISSFGGASLSVDNITLTTTDGVPLHMPPTSEFVGIASSKLDYIAKLERQREQRVLDDFEQLGLRAIVKVSAVVDFDSQTETVTKSEEGTPISSYTNTASTTSTERLPQGAPGAVANIPEAEAAPGSTQNVEETEETIENFQPSSTTTETIREPGKVKRYIVSAMVEGTTATRTDEEGNEISEYVPLSQEDMTKYEAYIVAAVGEGETPTEVTVYDHPFEIAGLTQARGVFQEIERAKTRDMVIQYVLNGGKVLLIVLLFLWVRRLLRGLVVSVPEEEETEVKRGLPEASAEDLRREELATEVARMAQEEPETVAALLRSWFAEDEE